MGRVFVHVCKALIPQFELDTACVQFAEPTELCSMIDAGVNICTFSRSVLVCIINRQGIYLKSMCVTPVVCSTTVLE